MDVRTLRWVMVVGGAAVLALSLGVGAFKRPLTDGPVVSNSVNMALEPRHPVTDAMRKSAEAVPGQVAPEIELADTSGKTVRLSDLVVKGPVLVVTIKDGCPCSIESQPFFNQMVKDYEGKFTILGVTDAPRIKAEKYKVDFDAQFPIVTEPGKRTFEAYHALNSVYSTLVGRDGVVIKQYPGYSKRILTDMNEQIAKAVGATPTPLDLADAPERDSSGCPFFEETPKT